MTLWLFFLCLRIRRWCDNVPSSSMVVLRFNLVVLGFIGFMAEQRKSLLQMQFKLRCNVVIYTSLVMQQLLIKLNTRLQIMLWFRVSTLYSQLGFFSPFIFWTTQFLNFRPLIYYRNPFFSLCFLTFLNPPIFVHLLSI